MAYNIFARDKFLAAAKEGKAPSDAVLRKHAVSEISDKATDGAQLSAMQRRFCISTDSPDRDNDVVAMSGWQLGNYQKNPVVLWAHDYSQLPLAKCVKVWADGHKLMAIADFADHDMARTVLRLIDGGFLGATSVGFRPLKYAINEDRKGLDFSEQELLEFSIVPVPANPEALIAAGKDGADVELLKSWASEILKSFGAQLKGVSPHDVSMTKAPEGTAWSAPTLSDFTDGSWDDLTDAQKRNIAGHYAWVDASVPTTFGDCKLPHHEAKSGAVVFRGVSAAAGRMNQAQIPSADDGAVKAHLARHYKQFGNVPPWDAQSAAWDAFIVKTVGKSDAEIASLADEAGFVDIAEALRPVSKGEPGMIDLLKQILAAVSKNNGAGQTPSGQSVLCTDCGQPMNGEPGANCLHPQSHELVPGVPNNGPNGKAAQPVMCAYCGKAMTGPAGDGCTQPDAHGKSADATQKRGRVLSAANEAHIKAASDHLGTAADHLNTVLKSLPDGDGGDGGSQMDIDFANIEFKVASKVEDIDLGDIKAEDVAAAVRDALKSGVTDIVRTETANAIARARGRVD